MILATGMIPKVIVNSFCSMKQLDNYVLLINFINHTRNLFNCGEIAMSLFMGPFWKEFGKIAMFIQEQEKIFAIFN